MICPKDKTSCSEKQFDGIALDVCPKCDGVWIESTELGSLVRKLQLPEYTSTDELLAQWDAVKNSGDLPKDFWAEDIILCPHGHGNMSKHYYAGSDIGIDQCQICQGIWLDGGELHSVAQYVEPNPDLDRAWQTVIQDQNKQRKDLENLQRLPARIAGIALSATTLPGLMAVAAGFVAQAAIDGLTKAHDDLKM
tara:strand:- start:2160 stop:2741 length:582 start_codon:yes stop_codon:yes gene_type:complete